MKQISYSLVKKFQCIGSDCPSSCCDTGWSILYDRHSYTCAQHQNQIQNSPIELSKGIQEKESNEDLFPIKLRNGRCFFLQTDGLCTIHKRLGSDVLPSICRTFPRELKQSGTTKELSASLSCPEIARIFIEEEDAISIVEADIDKSLLMKLDTSQKPQLSRLRNIVLSYMESHLQRNDNICYVLKKMLYVSRYSLQAYTRNQMVDTKALIQLCTTFPINKMLSFSQNEISLQNEGTFLLFAMEQVVKGCSLPHSYSFCYQHLNNLLIAANQPLIGEGSCNAEEIFSVYKYRCRLLKDFAGKHIQKWFHRWFVYNIRGHWVIEEESWMVYNLELILHSFVMNILLSVHSKAIQGIEQNNISFVKEAMIEVLFHSNRIFRHCPKSKEEVLTILKDNPEYGNKIIDMLYLIQ